MARKRIATSSSRDAPVSRAPSERLIVSRCSAASGPKYDTASACSVKKRSRSASIRSTVISSREAVGALGTTRGADGGAPGGRANGDRVVGRGGAGPSASRELVAGGGVIVAASTERPPGGAASCAAVGPAGDGN